jgi:threonine dehydrogenase-like Zn-dependent dehydrogenase
VVVTDVRPDKRERALALGATAAIDAAAPDVVTQTRGALGESADMVFDCVAIEPTVRQAIGMASKGGTVVIVGVPSTEVSIPLAIVQDQQIRIQGSATYLKPDYDESIELLQTGAVRPDDIITAVLPLDDVATAFDASSSGEEVKVLVTIAEDATL